MTKNEELITSFYESFKQKDFLGMQTCYADNATFSDEVFKQLNASEVRAMWEMLLTRGKDLVLEYKNVQANETSASAQWIATYTFSKTNRKVTNRITAHFSIKDGKIVSHTDKFDFYKWSRQALGFAGALLGWTSYLRKKVQMQAQKQLAQFMNDKEKTNN